MRHLIRATSIAIALASVGGVSAAQDETRTTTMRDVNVNALPGAYETYVADLRTGYTFHALVGHSHRAYVQARREAERSESLRKRGLATQPYVAVAVDDSTGPGVARQFQLIDGNRRTVAIVNVYCKQSMPSGAPRCMTAPFIVGGASQDLAATSIRDLTLAEVARAD